MLALSKTSKLDGILSWSLQALDTCPGSKNKDGSLVDACKGCYATTGNYHYPNVKKPRIANRDDWQRQEWVQDMVKALDSQRYFRWFDSGDVYTIDLAEKILAVMQATPWVKHWMPTRMAKFAKFKKVLSEMESLPNVKVRFSSDSVTGEHTSAHGSTIVPTAADAPKNAFVCQAYQHDGKCNGCRACYDKSVSLIAYPAHGAKMGKIIKLIAVKS
jgi:hypothetical protein